MAGKKGMKHYPLAMKLEAVRLQREEGKSYQETTKLLGIADRKRVENGCENIGPKGRLPLVEVPGIHHYENVLNLEFVASQPNQKWVTDVT